MVRRLGWIAVVVVAARAWALPSIVLAQPYTVEDLGTLDGHVPVVTAINDDGEVVGYVTPLQGPRAVRFRDATGIEFVPGLGTLNSFAFGVNAHGDVAGYALNTSGWSEAVRVTNAGLAYLGTLGGTGSFAYGINWSGQVAGHAFTAGNATFRAFRALPGLEPEDLGTLGGLNSRASAINDAGQVAGSAQLPTSVTRAFRYTDENGMEDLGTLGGSFSQGLAINGQGHVVGDSQTGNAIVWHAFRYTDEDGMVDIDTMGNPFSSAHAINDQGMIVGRFFSPSGYRAFLYTQASGMVDLNTLIDPDLGWVLTRADGINNAGQIIAIGELHDQTRAFRLSPPAAPDQDDDTPPTIAAAWADPGVIWPPDGRMVPVAVHAIVHDDADPAPACRITGVTDSAHGSSGQPARAKALSVQSDTHVTGDLTLEVRAARAGNDGERVYSIALTCSDASGNEVTTPVLVTVPHDRGGR